MTDDHISNQTRRRVLQLGGGALVAALAGCAGQGGNGGATESGMTESEMAEDMDGGEMTEMESEMTEDMDDEMTESEMDEGMDGETTRFRVRIENVSTASTLDTMDGGTAVPLSPGAFAVHTESGVLFHAEEAASDGLERLAEDGMPGPLVESIGRMEMGASSGAFDTPVGADSAGPLTPGDAYEFAVEAGSDARLSLATMFVQSNDLFYAPDPEGIALFEGGDPIDGDVTDRLTLWDAGTEVNEAPGSGPNQAPRQSGPDTGDEEMANVRPISAVDDGFTYPAVADVINVTVTPASMN
ncbi:spondin domain-containing protein [Salinigranum sp. GCM10025319]|uniref:spondin domain-containing protein n=1 Tax=Salinigranum sp. GCM10025319 TaxID=3252687 RepID=UPI003613550C